MASSCEVCALNIPPTANFCIRCGLRLSPATSAIDSFRESFVAKAGAAVLHGKSFLPSLIRFLFWLPLSVLLLSLIVRLILNWGGQKSWSGILMLSCVGFVGAMLPVGDQDRAGRWLLTWIGRVIWGAVLLGTLMAMTEKTAMGLR